jgi:hypothetical protein
MTVLGCADFAIQKSAGLAFVARVEFLVAAGLALRAAATVES